MSKPYSIGLDIGTGSVGWAVLDEDLKLIRKNMKVYGNTDTKRIKKNYWGVRLFETGQTAEATRGFRTSRRRLRRRRNRILYLQEIFMDEMEKVDPNFFHRLDSSFIVPEDKGHSKYPFFANMEEEKQYHEDYPTIYHLRKELADNDEKADLRLVYLAIAHILKYRGHFLIEGEIDLENTLIHEEWMKFIKEFNIQFPEEAVKVSDEDALEIEKIFKENISRSAKSQRVRKYLDIKTSHSLDKFLSFIVGNQGNFKNPFNLEEKAALQLTKDTYDEDLEELLAQIGDEYIDLFSYAKATYDAIELSDVLQHSDEPTNALLSANMIARYDEHGTDLEKLKQLISNHSSELYYEVFRDSTKKGYAGYIEGGATLEEFYKYLKPKINKIEGSEYFIEKMETEDLLRKQRTYHNGSIPHQVHQAELVAILDNQTKHYPFLAENKEKIIEIFKFRIPYYVGPLSKNKEDEFSWISRKSDEPIRPWNFNEIVNLEASATEFIERMTNYDTYLPDEKVLPKRSLLYQRYTILNELTKVQYEDERGYFHYFSKVEKEKILNELFKNYHSVTEKKLRSFINNELGMEVGEIRGVDNRFNSNYSTYLDLIKIDGMEDLLEKEDSQKLLEQIIFILTVFEDRKMKKVQLEQFSEQLTPEMIKQLARKDYTGWGRLSAKLLTGIRDKQTHKTIMDYLLDDDGVGRYQNRNFMQLINDENLSFKETIAKAQDIEDDQAIEDIVYELPGSPAIKKSILQTIKIVEEIVAIMGYPPESVVVEMAREHQTTSFGKSQSKMREEKLRTALKEFGSNILTEEPVSNELLRDDRLYLYYLQNGKDMYTGDPLDIHRLSDFDIDHIIPRSFTTDNSIDNKVLVSSASNRGKLDDVPSIEVVNRQRMFWESLNKSGLISDRKLNNLTKATRGGLSERDKERFLQRTLVETRQITKHIANILDTILNTSEDKKVDIVTIKSALASRFRRDFEIYKVREINDYHHAHDAYLNAVVANKVLKVNPLAQKDLVYGQFAYHSKNITNKATYRKYRSERMLDFFKEDYVIDKDTGEVLWDKNKDITTVQKVLSSKQMNIVKKVEEQSGELYKQTLNPKGSANRLIPIKTGMDIEKYGGYLNPKTAFTLAVKAEKGWQFIGVTMQEKVQFNESPEVFLRENGFNGDEEFIKLKKFTLYETKEGARRLISSHQEGQKGNQFVLSQHLIPMVYHAQRYDEVKYSESVEYVDDHIEDFDEIFNEIISFAEKYIQKKKVTEKVKKIYNDNDKKDIKDLSQSIINLFTLTTFGAPATFSFLGENIIRARYGITDLKNSTLIFYSVTGLYETRIDMEEY